MGGDLTADPDTVYVGVIAGINDGTIENCYNTCNLSEMTRDNDVAGIVGWNYGIITGCFNSGNIVDSGGIVGCNEGQVRNCYNTGEVTSDEIAGGIIGMSSTDIAKEYIANPGLVSNCYNTGNITSNGTAYGIVGGVVGLCETANGKGQACSVSNCFNSGKMTSIADAGGLIGAMNTGTITENSYNTGEVTGVGVVGGITGYNEGIGTSINSCYNTGKVAGSVATTGAVVGTNDANASLINCYYNSSTSIVAIDVGQNTGSQSATSLNTSQMIARNALTTMSGLATTEWQKRDLDSTTCYYPELTIFATGTTAQQVVSKNSVAVARLATIITETPSATDIAYGEALSASVLTGGTAMNQALDYVVLGTFAWADSTEILEAGVSGRNVIFVPTDELYMQASAMVNVKMETNADGVPRTGDNSNLWAPVMAMVLSLGGIVLVITRKRKKAR